MAWRWLLLLSLAALLQCGISQQSQRERERQQQRGETDPYYLMGWGNGRLRLEGDELGCPRSFNGCHCNYTEAPMALRPHRILNCSARALQKLPDFSRLVGYRFDQVLLDRNNISRLPKNAFMVRIPLSRGRILVRVTIYRRLRISRDVYFDQSKVLENKKLMHFDFSR